jgi:CDP-ribitol ribitolphosphotransferase
VTRLEYLLSAAALRVLGWLFSLLPARPRNVVLATARTTSLDGNLLHLHAAVRRYRPDVDVTMLLEPYGYGLGAKLRYLGRVVRGMYHLRTAGLFIVDNAYLPIHVARHGSRTTVVQVWHAAGALKRFGVDTVQPLAEPERTFLHRHYDWVVTAGEASRLPWARAFRTSMDRVIPLGSARTDFFFDADARATAAERLRSSYPALADRRVVVYAPTFRGRGRAKRASSLLDGSRLRDALPLTDVLVLKGHPNLDPALVATEGFDVVVDRRSDINELLSVTDILITDYSSSIFEYALLRRPLVLLVGDLDEYERDPGLYLDYRREMIGTQVSDTDGVIDAILADRFDLDGYDAFIARHLGACDGNVSRRIIEHFVPSQPAV